MKSKAYNYYAPFNRLKSKNWLLEMQVNGRLHSTIGTLCSLMPAEIRRCPHNIAQQNSYVWKWQQECNVHS